MVRAFFASRPHQGRACRRHSAVSWLPVVIASVSVVASIGCVRRPGFELARTVSYGRPDACPDVPLTYELDRVGSQGGDTLRCSYENLGSSDALLVRGVVLAEGRNPGENQPNGRYRIEIEPELATSGTKRRRRARSKAAGPAVTESDEQGRFQLVSRDLHPPMIVRAVDRESGRVVAWGRVDDMDVRVVDEAAPDRPGAIARHHRRIELRLVIPATRDEQGRPPTGGSSTRGR